MDLKQQYINLSTTKLTAIKRNKIYLVIPPLLRYDNLDLIINQTVKKALIHDLNEIDDEKRILT